MRFILALVLLAAGVAQAANLTGTATASNSPKTAEGPAQAFDGSTSTKWLGGVTTSTWLQLTLSTPSAISGYAITSANDSPERDPRDVVLEGSNDGSTWITIDTHSFTFTARFQKQAVTVSPSAAYSRYRLRIVANNGSKEVITSGITGLVQLSELELVQATAPTPPVDPTLTGSQTLNWGPPTKNTDGTSLTNLVGYRIYFSQTDTSFTKFVEVLNPGATTHTVDGLVAGKWYFALSTVTTTGESALSPVISGTVTGPTLPPPPPPPVGAKVVPVVAGLNMSPVFSISSTGARGSTVLGFVPVGKPCTGSPAYAYRGQSYYRFSASDAVWWQSTATSAAAVACK